MKKLFVSSVLMMLALFVNARVVTDSIESKVLSCKVKYNVYLPAGFNKNAPEKYPVLYLLHGFTDTYTAWVMKGRVQEIADELLQTGEMCPMVIIMPNAGGPDTKNTWNGYFNMEGWKYEDFFFNELIPQAEKRYNIVGDRQHRAVSGLSMGGGGSTGYALTHPDMFSSCYLMSAWLESEDNELDPNDKSTYVRHAVHSRSAIDFVSSSSEDIVNKLKTLKWFIDVGDDDFLLSGNIKFYQAMQAKHIPCELRVRNGAHNWEYWHTALRTSLPFATRNFSK
ncbi:MAG: esterase family protein [Bacteroidaceae bacterium]|nr:esterase family protein [Bacteroidaceae bacterium]